MISRFFPALRMELPCLEHIEHMAMAKSQAWTMGIATGYTCTHTNSVQMLIYEMSLKYID